MRISRPFQLACVALVVGCSDINRSCTLIGCISGVTVHLSALPSQPFRVEIASAGSDIAYTFDCTTNASRCRQDILFPDLTPSHMVVTVRVGTASRVTQINQVNYTRNQPNGPSCPGDCQNADVDAAIP